MAYRELSTTNYNTEKTPLSLQGESHAGLPVISVFSGAGGMDLGFHKAGYKTVFSADNNPTAVKTFNLNFPGNVSRCVDLGKTYIKPFLEMVESATDGRRPRGIIGGPPCQGVSRGNSQSQSNDPRNKLMTTYTRLLNALEDKYGIDFFVFENVPDLRSSRNETRYKTLMTALRQRFTVYEKELNACDFGVPQVRERLFIVGINKALTAKNIKFEFPTPGANRVTVKEAISHLPEPAFFKRGILENDIPHHPNHWTMNPRSHRFSQPDVISTGRSFRRLGWNQPSYTVAYGNREIHVHPNGTRRLSIYEAMLLQGFDPDFRMLGSLSAQVTQVSNAVAPPVAYAIAAAIKQSLYPDYS